jgi:hypothetical protein
MHSKKKEVYKGRGAGSLASSGLLLQRMNIDIKKGNLNPKGYRL